MLEEGSLIVDAAGRQLDLLRHEARRIVKGSKIDWRIEPEKGAVRFCFKDEKAKKEFANICHSFGIPSRNV
jgi:hypothetical protein